jgi:hypothetical protein
VRDFDQEITPTRPLEDRAFRLGGQLLHSVDSIPGEIMVSLGRITVDSPVLQDMGVISGLIFELVEPEDHDALRAALAIRGPGMVDLSKLADVVGWIMGEATGRPLAPSETSGLSVVTPSSTDNSMEPSPSQAQVV